jgi:Methylamine utilisation protein MauE
VVAVEPLNSALLTVRYVLALVLLAAAVPKFADRHRFQRSVADYRVLPPRLVAPAAAAIQWIEAGSAVALFAGLAVGVVASIDGLLFLAFCVAAGRNLRLGRRIDCGCFGSVARRTIGWDVVALDLVCAAMAGAIVTAAVRPWVHGTALSRPSAESGISLAPALLAGALVAIYLLVTSWLGVRSALVEMPPLVREDRT